MSDLRAYWIFLFFSCMYVGLAWIVSGGDTWWIIDFVDGQNIFFGDDAYRFFLSRGAWVNADLYTYNFILPGQLFLDGAITKLVDGDLFLSRAAHALVGAGGLSLLYLCSCQLGLSRSGSLAAVVLAGFIPRYALMSISFYGEAWLGFFSVVSLYFFLRKNFLLMAVVAGWLPLLRPEGIFFLVSIGLFLLQSRRVKETAILLMPGLLYFFFLCLTLSSLGEYSYWRQELRTILSKLDHLFGDWDLLFLYSFFFTVPAVLASFSSPARRMWPFLLGALFWVAWFQLLLLNELATFENRYSYVLIPFLALLWVAFFDAARVLFATCLTGRWVSIAHKVVVVSVALAVVGSHLVKTNNIRLAIQRHGYSGTLEKMVQGKWGELYGYHTKETLEARTETVRTIEGLIAEDRGIDNISIYAMDLFYYLDPEKIPSHVTVGFLTNGYMVFHMLLGGQSFIQHSGGRMYSYMDYGEPDFRQGERRAIVVTIMPLEDYPYTWKRGGIEMYLFSYLESDKARVDISDKPKITPKMLQEAYAPWYGK